MQKRIAKDLFTYLPAKALPALASFITVPIYTRLFSPDLYGTFVLAVATAEFLLLATATGFGQGAVRFFSAYEHRSRLPSYFAVVVGSVGLITLVVAAAVAGILVIFGPLISPDLYPLLWAALALFVANACYAILMDVLRGQENSRWYASFSIGQAFGSILLGLLLVLVFRMGIVGLVWGQTLSLLLPIVPLAWLTTRSVAIHTARVDRSDWCQLWRFALPFAVGNIAFWVLSLSDRYIIEIFRGNYEVGLYAVANKVSARSIQLLASLFFLVPAPMICRLWEERGRQVSEEALTEFTRMFFLLVIPAVSGLAVIAAPLIRLLVDEAYFDGHSAIWLVACGAMGLGLSDLGSSGSLVTNHTRLIARNQCIAAGSAVILNLVLVPLFGFMGAAVGAALSFFLLAGLQALTSARFLTWRWPLTSLWRVLTASTAMSASVLLVQVSLRSDTTAWQVGSLLLSILVGALVYTLILWILREISPQHLIDLFRADRQRSTVNPVAGEMGHK